MQKISKVRFEALGAYCRKPEAQLFAEEVGWFQERDEQLLITLIRDRSDDDFSSILLSRDIKKRYRWVGMTAFFSSSDEALKAADKEIEKVIANLEGESHQGDEKGRPVDFFTPVVKSEKLNRDFVSLTTQEGYSPAKDIIEPMMRWYEGADGNFIEQFQTTGFDARIWELYLFAMLVEAGYTLDRKEAIPDFSASGFFGDLCIEATTVNSTRDKQGAVVPPPPLDTEEQFLAFQREYMPIKFAGPLTAKLAKKYWERQNVEGKPLVFAIQDFHAPMSMTRTRAGLSIYLYGYDHDWKKGADGKLIITPRKVMTHKWGEKEIPSGFFNLPGAENISAVIANTSATISKFDRIGVMAGFGSKRARLVRRGFAADPNPNAELPKKFVMDVNSTDYHETWIEGLDVYHNPKAKHPLSHDMFPGAAHHRLLKNGMVESLMPLWHPLSSQTLITIG